MTHAKKFISLFGGIGGFDLALSRQGWECSGYYEIDSKAVSQYNKKFNSNHQPTDITKLDTRDIPEHDLLCGGFPCQAFSLAGKRRGFEDTRGTLFFEIARILRAKRPKVVLLENVKGLLNHEGGGTFTIILQTMAELGYEFQHMVLNSKFFGVPQNRERVFIVGNLRGESRPEILPFREGIERGNEGTEQTSANTLTAGGHSGGHHSSMTLLQVGNVDQKGHNSLWGRVYSPEGVSSNLNSNGGGLGAKTGLYLIQSHSPRSGDPTKGGTGPLVSSEHCFTLDSTPHNVIMRSGIRRLTPTECERLQGFPDGWTEGQSDTQRYKQLGNAVTVNVIEAIAKKMVLA